MDDTEKRSARSGRSTRTSSTNNSTLIYAAAGGGALLLLLLVIAFSGESRPKRKARKMNVQPIVTSQSSIDWYTRGVRDGRDWAARARRRHQEISATTVNEIAERMPSNYVNKGIDPAGEKRFMKGFKDGVYGK